MAYEGKEGKGRSNKFVVDLGEAQIPKEFEDHVNRVVQTCPHR